jgi:hypothetical protein
VSLDGSERDSVTVLASVAGKGTKLPLFGIAKGKTMRMELNRLGLK